MKITTAKGIIEGESIEAILEKYGRDCLRGANLYEFGLSNADLRGASLRNANLRNAYLSNANLCYSDLRGADLNFANLYHANLRGANLYGADLRGADLRDTNLCHSDLRGANLRNADLRGADGADLITARASIIPDEGDIIGWKKAYVDDTMPPRPVIVKLLIPADAQRSNATGRKCRGSKARVLDLQDKQGNSLPPDTTAYSSHDPDFTYKKGETVHVEDFDTNRWNECAPGIHFFITRAEAVAY